MENSEPPHPLKSSKIKTPLPAASAGAAPACGRGPHGAPHRRLRVSAAGLHVLYMYHVELVLYVYHVELVLYVCRGSALAYMHHLVHGTYSAWYMYMGLRASAAGQYIYIYIYVPLPL